VPSDSIEMIDKCFTSKNINDEIGHVDEKAIDDKMDPSFQDYTYFPERDANETGSWPPLGKSNGFEWESPDEYEPSKSQPSSYTYTNPAERILEAHGLGRLDKS